MLPFQEFDVNLPVVELPRLSDVSRSVFIGDGESVIGIVIGDTVFTEAHVSHENKIIMSLIYTCGRVFDKFETWATLAEQ